MYMYGAVRFCVHILYKHFLFAAIAVSFLSKWSVEDATMQGCVFQPTTDFLATTSFTAFTVTFQIYCKLDANKNERFHFRASNYIIGPLNKVARLVLVYNVGMCGCAYQVITYIVVSEIQKSEHSSIFIANYRHYKFLSLIAQICFNIYIFVLYPAQFILSLQQTTQKAISAAQ